MNPKIELGTLGRIVKCRLSRTTGWPNFFKTKVWTSFLKKQPRLCGHLEQDSVGALVSVRFSFWGLWQASYAGGLLRVLAFWTACLHNGWPIFCTVTLHPLLALPSSSFGLLNPPAPYHKTWTREMGGYTRVVSAQRLGKYVPVATNTNATIYELFHIWSVPKYYKQRTRLELSQFCRGVCEKRTWVGGRGIAIVEAVTTKRLVTDWEH
jgi:hypothetical protein